jgi:RNA polymerase sigma-70 factor (ECF subfamily)
VDERADEQLMTAVLAGDRAALAALVERHYAPVLGYLYRLVGGRRALAEDLAQETFICLLRPSGYQPSRPFKPWLYAVATNQTRDHFKSAAVRHTATGQDEALLEVHDATPGPEDLALAAEQGSAVASAIGRVGEEYRATLLLRFYNGLSLQEIAAALDVPLGTVKSRLSVGTRRLRELLTAAQEGASR